MQQKKKSDAAGRAWNLLRLVLLWARKGGVYRRRLMMDLRLFPKFLKTLAAGGHSSRRCAIPYGERELSFDKTPIIHIKMHRPSSMRFRLPHIPCINPHNDFDFDFNDESDGVSYCNEEARMSFLMSAEEDRIECEVDDGDEGIDLKAEKFIANFYKQMKLQRQVSYLQYNEMLNRGTG